MQAPKTIAERIAASGFASDSEITAKVTPAIAATPAASPSSPSRKLTMFMIATIQTIVSSTPTEPGRRREPHEQAERDEGAPDDLEVVGGDLEDGVVHGTARIAQGDVHGATLALGRASPLHAARLQSNLVQLLRSLFRAVQAIAGVAEAGDDETALVQGSVDGGADDVHVGMVLVDELDAGGRGDDADE